MKKQELIKNLINFVNFEEEITYDLTKNYIKKIKNSTLTQQEQKGIMKRLKILLKETEEHYTKFNKLIEEVKKSKKQEF